MVTIKLKKAIKFIFFLQKQDDENDPDDDDDDDDDYEEDDEVDTDEDEDDYDDENEPDEDDDDDDEDYEEDEVDGAGGEISTDDGDDYVVNNDEDDYDYDDDDVVVVVDDENNFSLGVKSHQPFTNILKQQKQLSNELPLENGKALFQRNLNPNLQVKYFSSNRINFFNSKLQYLGKFRVVVDYKQTLKVYLLLLDH